MTHTFTFTFTFSQLSQSKQEWRDLVFKADHCLAYMQPGRLVRISNGDDEWGWGVVINFQKKKQKNQLMSADIAANATDDQYVVDVLLRSIVDKDSAGPKPEPRPCPPGSKGGEMRVLPLLLPAFADISSARICLPKDLRPFDARQKVGGSIQQVQDHFKEGLPLLHPVDDMGIADPALPKLIQKIEGQQKKLVTSEFHGAKDRVERYAEYEKKNEIGEVCSCR
jgi:ATP-dependent RNA helicase DOB1